MKTKLVSLFAILLAVAALIYGYVQLSGEKEADEEGDQAITAPSRVEQGTNGESIISLNPEAQKLIGLETATLTQTTQAPEIKAYGRVLDPSPLVSHLSELASARVAFDASHQEYQRLQSLFDHGGNASAKALETAEAVMKRDQIALKSAEAQLVTAWGRTIAQEPDLPAFVQSLVQLETAIVRLDLPVGEILKQIPTGARLMLPDGEGLIGARFLGMATTTGPLSQGQGYLFLVHNGPTPLIPGLSVSGFLQLNGKPLSGAILPGAAVVRASERSWVYVQSGGTNFARHEVALDYPVAGGWLVTNDVLPGDRIVVVGAQTLLSEERKGQIKIGD